MHFGSLGCFRWVGCSVMWRGNVETFHQQLASWAFSFCLYIYKIAAFNCWSSVWSKCHTYFPTISNLFVASISSSVSPLFCYQIISFGAACLLHPAKQRCALLSLVTFWQGLLWWNSCDHSELVSMILIPIWRMKYSVVIHWSSWTLSYFYLFHFTWILLCWCSLGLGHSSTMGVASSHRYLLKNEFCLFVLLSLRRVSLDSV